MALNNLQITTEHNRAQIDLHGDMDVTLGVGLPASFNVLFFTTTSEKFAIKTIETIIGLDGKATQLLNFGGSPGLSIKLAYNATDKKWMVVDNNIMRSSGVSEHLIGEYEWEKEALPTIRVAAIPGSVTAAGNVTITATVSSPYTVDYVEFYRNDVKVATDRAAPYSFVDPVTIANNGSISYHAKLFDTRNNIISSEPVTVVVNIAPPVVEPEPTPDSTPPSVNMSVDTTSFTAPGILTLTAQANDDVGVTKVEFLRNGVVFAVKTVAPYSTTQGITDADNGTIVYAARAHDSRNSTTTPSVNVSVQISKPSEVTQLTVDTSITSSTEGSIAIADSGTSATGKRLAAAQAIIDQMSPSHTLNIYRDGLTIFSAKFAGPMTIYNDGKDIGVGLNDVVSGVATRSADINTGKWAFQLVGGASGQRLIAGTVGPTGSGADIILQDSPFQGQQFDAIVIFILDRSIDGLS